MVMTTMVQKLVTMLMVTRLFIIVQNNADRDIWVDEDGDDDGCADCNTSGDDD